MEKREIPEIIKKNILDLNYNKNLQYFNTTIIIILSYVIGIIIAFITGNINPFNTKVILMLIIITIIFLSISLILLIKFKDEMNKITKRIIKIKL